MRKHEVNAHPIIAFVDDPPQRDGSIPDDGVDPAGFDNLGDERPERRHFDALLPFLEERIAFKMPSESDILTACWII
jgi:hypothetical protein